MVMKPVWVVCGCLTARWSQICHTSPEFFFFISEPFVTLSLQKKGNNICHNENKLTTLFRKNPCHSFTTDNKEISNIHLLLQEQACSLNMACNSWWNQLQPLSLKWETWQRLTGSKNIRKQSSTVFYFIECGRSWFHQELQQWFSTRLGSWTTNIIKTMLGTIWISITIN